MNSKKQIRTLIMLVLITISTSLFSQDSLKIEIDNHYNGGEEALFKYIKEHIVYPEIAKTDGLVGLSVFYFKIDCENKPYNFKFQTRLGYGIDEGLQKTIENTAGNWFDCDENTNTGYVALKIAFDINKYYNSDDADFEIYVEGPYKVYSDEDLVQFFNNRLKKENYKQAKPYLELLLLRYPFSEDYKNTLYKINSRAY